MTAQTKHGTGWMLQTLPNGFEPNGPPTIVLRVWPKQVGIREAKYLEARLRTQASTRDVEVQTVDHGEFWEMRLIGLKEYSKTEPYVRRQKYGHRMWSDFVGTMGSGFSSFFTTTDNTA